MSKQADQHFAKIAAQAAPQEATTWGGHLTTCDECGSPFKSQSWMIDGVIPGQETWGNYCTACSFSNHIKIGRGYGQLYQRQTDTWVLVAGMDAQDDE